MGVSKPLGGPVCVAGLFFVAEYRVSLENAFQDHAKDVPQELDCLGCGFG